MVKVWKLGLGGQVAPAAAALRSHQRAALCRATITPNIISALRSPSLIHIAADSPIQIVALQHYAFDTLACTMINLRHYRQI
jgi:hypothetical protein